ncbi:MAG TPA: NAD(P)/FAD-dependent oxidoreductase [Opitutaceae bacterium]|nr:NAD(P)/FAD-dependent oxidoreductase [Opitutaceae bacterium]
MNSGSEYDVAIIGAGLSGLAAGIRLAHFGKKVCIFERHNKIGGLNSFYSQNGRKFDVGLHALTNYVPAGVKGTPLGKILRQLRIEREEFALCPQKGSRVSFGPAGETTLRFTNDYQVLESEVAAKFPAEIDAFRRITAYVRDMPLAGGTAGGSAREFVRGHFRNPLLEDMLLCPLMFYGSAREDDMDVGQFAIMFRALYLEGFARPLEGVRVMMNVLSDKYRDAGGERRMKCGVKSITVRDGKATSLVLDTGEEITAAYVLSSAGALETAALIGEKTQKVRTLGYVETISVLDRAPAEFGWGDDTIVFFNDSERFDYRDPKGQVDLRSGIICIPNNFQYGEGVGLPEGVFRVTCLANYDFWAGIPEETYLADKARWFGQIQDSARRFMPALADASILAKATIATDMFTPTTVEWYTGHVRGAIYGAPEKNPGGRTALSNLFICGTDQGMLGIVGSMLSGISMANQHILQAP